MDRCVYSVAEVLGVADRCVYSVAEVLGVAGAMDRIREAVFA